MQLRSETGLGIGTLVVLQLCAALLAVTLLARMGPAIGHILDENVYSGEAVEQMLAALVAPESRGDFDAALERARANVTEEEERPLLETITADRDAAFLGDRDARSRVVVALRGLGEVNRESMQRADDEARRMGRAGAWAAALLSALALGLGVVVYRRLRLRLELPVEELRRAIADVRRGNLQARCVISEAPQELLVIADDVNWVLDAHLSDEPVTPQAGGASRPWREVLAWAMDRSGRPEVVLDASGERVLSSLSALEVEAEVGGPGWELEDVRETGFRVARFMGEVERGGT